jgi:basic membrane protein A
MTVACVFTGSTIDSGFTEAGLRGLQRARDAFGVDVWQSEGTRPETARMIDSLREVIARRPALVVAHGGQFNEAAQAVATEHPDIRFAVTQGSVTGPNLASYDVLQEQSAFLAGVLAALTTRTGVVGHLSGIRVRPGLKGRAAFVAGARHANAKVRVLTGFCGTQDDSETARRFADAQIAAGVDVLFTMLNAGRSGASEACRAGGARQIGNVRDWVAADPQTFVGSALADVGIGVHRAVEAHVRRRFPAGSIVRIGLEDPAAVSLTMADDVPASVRARVDAVRVALGDGSLPVPDSYDGPEFAPPDAHGSG